MDVIYDCLQRVFKSAFLLILIDSQYSFAMTIEPMIVEIAPYGSQSQKIIYVRNDSTRTIALETIPSKISFSKSGEEVRKAFTDELLVIPMVTVISPGKSQAVMVRYIGEPDINESISYSMLFQQQDAVSREQSDSGIKLNINFNTLVSVVPDNTTSKLSITSVELTDDGKWRIVINNSGNRYARVSKSMLMLTSNDGTQFHFDGHELSKQAKGGLILPGSTRIFEVSPLLEIDLEEMVFRIESID